MELSSRSIRTTEVTRFDGSGFASSPDVLAAEEPLEMRLVHGPRQARVTRAISVTMRTPGHDAELAAGFLVTEGVVRDANDIERVRAGEETAGNTIVVELHPDVAVNEATLQRNFYTTSSCGICGKASLLALQTVCPPRRAHDFVIAAETLCALPERLRAGQGIFDQTGGLHAAALFSADGQLDSMREDVGRHNAVDKLVGAAVLADRLPLGERMLLLSGRASFELLQKALMAGIPLVASVGAPSSLAVEVACRFNIALVGFLRGNHFNVYHGMQRIRAAARELAHTV